jgi:hypothetical protein
MADGARAPTTNPFCIAKGSIRCKSPCRRLTQDSRKSARSFKRHQAEVVRHSPPIFDTCTYLVRHMERGTRQVGVPRRRSRNILLPSLLSHQDLKCCAQNAISIPIPFSSDDRNVEWRSHPTSRLGTEYFSFRVRTTKGMTTKE